jgi:DNA repair protein RadA/Sms
MATKSKSKKAYFCKSCGNEFAQWMGKCPACNEWNSLIEELVIKEDKQARGRAPMKAESKKALPLSEIHREENERIPTGYGELDRVLGGGLVPGSIVLLGGEPGIGKSTLTLQVAMELKSKVLYISGEESLQQIKMRQSD